MGVDVCITTSLTGLVTFFLLLLPFFVSSQDDTIRGGIYDNGDNGVRYAEPWYWMDGWMGWIIHTLTYKPTT
ncbi:hypothetical protein BO85DRAFT_14305 [Aspergillus piperis CBS 112811]|uniref:Uncharacterized protein n=1 Tax=Aspergillus piperis CBS 112811 TaxID=1448313 RepID=A0A8G1RDC7_9EURO|nr:hypothetical protein BO85DRAFT_14305 [Aspergillus piperis CBS 112811]RAH62982.1 hypothetical protein BO85DRAFT_14305 [Aspergillus piperis CBS 112811]